MVFVPMEQSEENQPKLAKSTSVLSNNENNVSSAPDNPNPMNGDNWDIVSVTSSVCTRRGFVPLADDTELICLNEDVVSQRPAASICSSQGFVSKSVSTLDINLIDGSVNNPVANSPIPEILMPEYEELSKEITVDDDSTSHIDKKNLLNSSPTLNSDSSVNVCYSPDFLEKYHSSTNSNSKSFVQQNSSIDFNFENNKTILSSACSSPSGSPYSAISMPLNNTSMEVNVSGSFSNQTPKTTTIMPISKSIATEDKLSPPVDNSGDNVNSLVGQSDDKKSIRETSPTVSYALSPLHPNVKQLFELANGAFADRISTFSSVASNESHLSNSKISISETNAKYLNLGRGRNFFNTQNLPSSSSLIPTAIKPHVDDPNDCITFRNMKRWFYQIDLMLSSVEQKLSNDHTDDFYFGLISKANDYIQKFNQLSDLPEITSVHFSEINIYIERLKEYVSTLDRLLRSKTLKDELEKVTAKACINSISLCNHYDGNILHWPSFWATYQNLVLNNSTLSNFVKFHLLYDNVDGMTRMLLHDIDPINPDLQLASSRLSSHFDDHDTVLFGFNSALKQLPFVKNTFLMENWYMLMESTMLVKRFLSGKQSQNDLEYEKECVIILLGKLPPKHTEDYFKIPDIDWKLNHFIAYCQKKIAGLKRMSYLGVDLKTIPFSDCLCPICKKDYHFPERCDFSLVERKEIVRANRLCLRCLEVEYFHGHFCQNKCENCGGDHHLALCNSYRVNDFQPKNTQSDHNQVHHSSSSRGPRSSTELAQIEMPEVEEIQADLDNYHK